MTIQTDLDQYVKARDRVPGDDARLNPTIRQTKRHCGQLRGGTVMHRLTSQAES
jgi:hypothetical protein